MIGQLIQAALGVWLTAAPAVLGFEPSPAATNHHIVGPLVASFAVVAVAECTRGVRWWNVPLAVWMMLAPLVLVAPGVGSLHSAAAGVAILALCFARGRVKRSYGGGWMVLFRRDQAGAGTPAR